MLNLSHKTLEVYNISLLMVNEIYQITKQYPSHERFALISQLRRAAVSVSSNIAEGAARTSAKEKKRFYEISRSSLVEIDTQLEISLLMKYINTEQVKELEKMNESIFKILSKMIFNLRLNQSAITNYAPLVKPY